MAPNDIFPPGAPHPGDAQPTGTLWGGVFGGLPGIGPIMKLINDPELGANARKAIQALIEGQARVGRLETQLVRLEEKIDQLLRHAGHDEGTGRNRLAAVPTGVSDGTGTDAVAGDVAHARSGGVASLADAPVDTSGRGGDSGGAVLDAGRHGRHGARGAG